MRRLPETIAAYEVVLAQVAGRLTWKAMEAVPEILEHGEPLLALARAMPGANGAVVAVTDRRLLIVPEGARGTLESLPLTGWQVEFKRGFFTGAGVVVTGNDRTLKLRQLLPSAEGQRILVALGGERDPKSLSLLPEGFPADPPGPPIAALAGIAVYPDRIIDPEMRHLPFHGAVEARAGLAGDLAVEREGSLPPKDLRDIPDRELCLLVEGPDWSLAQQFPPTVEERVKDLAKRINSEATP